MRSLAITLAAGIILAGPVFPCSYSWMIWEPSGDAAPGYYPIWTGPEQGWIDRSGKRIDFEPQPIPADPHRLMPFREGDLFGYTRRGQTVIPPRFLEAGEFHDGRARVVVEGPCVPAGGNMCGGEVLLPRSALPRTVSPLDIQSRRWTPTAPDCRYTFIDERGEILGPDFSEAASFREGMAAVRVGEFWGYIHRSLSVVVRPRFRAVAGSSEGLAAVLQQLSRKTVRCGPSNRHG